MIGAIEELGGAAGDVVRTRMFLTRIEDWEAGGAVHGEFFKDIRPAATMVEVSRLIDERQLIEIEVDACLSEAD